MPDLSRTWTWERYEPNLGDNREQAQPFWFKVKTGLTKIELSEFGEKLSNIESGKYVETMAELLSSVVEFGNELSIKGKPINDLKAYLDLLVSFPAGFPLIQELVKAVFWYNSVDGARALFSERLSGGTAFMPIRTERAAQPNR